jgi:hypothetical protein
MSNLIKTRPVGAKLLHADRHTDGGRKDGHAKVILDFRNFAKAPKSRRGRARKRVRFIAVCATLIKLLINSIFLSFAETTFLLFLSCGFLHDIPIYVCISHYKHFRIFLNSVLWVHITNSIKLPLHSQPASYC